MKEEGKNNREISEYYCFGDKQVIKQLIARHHREQKKIEAGILIRPKGRPRKGTEFIDEQNKDNEIQQLKMESATFFSSACWKEVKPNKKYLVIYKNRYKYPITKMCKDRYNNSHTKDNCFCCYFIRDNYIDCFSSASAKIAKRNK